MSKIMAKPGTMLYPVPTVMASCSDGTTDNIITIGWSGIINSDPPMTYISVRKSRYSHELIRKSGAFVINLVNEDLVRAADFCGVKSGRDLDKWKEMNLHREASDVVPVPMIAESPVSLECQVKDVLELGSHDMFLAEIVAVHIDEQYVAEDGAYQFERMRLTAFNHGSYYGLGREPIGSFGFSVMKPKTAKRKRREAAEKRKKSRKDKLNTNRKNNPKDFHKKQSKH